jgi:glycosyltransferase involved in cell wall biosynthesis
VRALFLNEGIGGNSTMHEALRVSLADRSDVEATFVDVPPPGPIRKLAAAPVPGLARLDLDLQPLRYQLAQSAQVRGLLRRAEAHRRFDVAHVYTHNVALLSVGWLRKHPLVVALDATATQNAYHLPYRWPSVGTPMTARLSELLVARVHDAAELVVAKSEWAARSLRESGVPADKVRVVPFGVTVPAADTIRRPHEGLRLAFIGATLARKGGLRLLRIWRERLRDRCTLMMVTAERVPPEPGLEVINDARIGDGKVERLLAMSDLLVFPTEIDNFGYAALEAMASGVPVVATRINALPEIVEDGVSGLLLPLGDERGLGDAIEMLLDDAGRRIAMGSAARARVEERFDARRTSAMLLPLMEEAQDRFRSG